MEKPHIQQYLADYLSTYLTGLDNSRIYGKKIAIKKEVKAAYEQFIQENQTSKYHNIVKEYYAMINKNDFVVPKNYGAFFKKMVLRRC